MKRKFIKIKIKIKIKIIDILLFSFVFLFTFFVFAVSFYQGRKSSSGEKSEISNYKKLSFEKRSESVKKWQKTLREKLVELAGASPESSIVNATWIGELEDKGLYQEQQLKLLFNINKEVLCHLLRPKESQNKTPAVIFFPGNGEGITELLEEPKDRGPYYQQAAAKYLTENGFITLVCEPWAFWSSSSWQGQKQTAINEYFLKGSSIMGIYIDQARAEFTYLESLENIDPKKIGLAGASFGGGVTFYTAAVDERISASFVSGFFTTFETTYFHHIHGIEMIIPGIYQYADIPDVAGLIAPRKVMFDNGEEDVSLALPGTEAEKLVEQKIKPIFKHLGAETNVSVNKTDKGHVLDKEAALKFFKQAFDFDE